MKDITTLEDIKLMVDTFYDSVRDDDLLAPIFNGVIKDNWPKHLDTMYRFWQTVLLHELAYKGAPFLPHRQLPISERHFQRWLLLFKNSIDKNFEGKVATEAKWRAEKMAEMFKFKINNKSF